MTTTPTITTTHQTKTYQIYLMMKSLDRKHFVKYMCCVSYSISHTYGLVSWSAFTVRTESVCIWTSLNVVCVIWYISSVE